MTQTDEQSLHPLALTQIRLDGGTQSRVTLNETYIQELAQELREGVILPPVLVYFDGSAYWLADGFHRYHAYQHNRCETLVADVRPGTRRDAVLAAVGANAQHGLRRTNADKRHAVEMLLHDPAWFRWSNRAIARQCAVDESMVRGARASLSTEIPQMDRLVERRGTIYTMHAACIGHTARTDLSSQEALSSTVPAAQGAGRALSAHQEQDEKAPWPEEAQRAGVLATESEGEAPMERLFEERLAQERRDAHVLRVMGSSESPEWYTPQDIVQLACTLLGTIDLDPCSNSRETPTVPARLLYTKEENGLLQPWSGTVYLNPPYGHDISQWIDKLVRSYEAGAVEEALALLPGRIDTAWFRPLYAYRICHIQGRLRFANSPYSAPFPCVIVYLGKRPDAFAEVFGCKGPILKRVG